jgi:hypothetical protein
MVQQSTCVIVKATYIEIEKGQPKRWTADESQAFGHESSTVSMQEVTQFELTILSLVCLSLLIMVATLFVSQ